VDSSMDMGIVYDASKKVVLHTHTHTHKKRDTHILLKNYKKVDSTFTTIAAVVGLIRILAFRCL
jgi:hypothetical protein